MTLALGLMSGTSCDGISAALIDIGPRTCRVVAFDTTPYPAALGALLRRARELSTSGVAQLNILLGECEALAALQLLRRSRVPAQAIAVIGSHGHTVYHGPRDPIPCTLQLGEPAIIAERTGCAVVADFRMRDLAAYGEGAPLVPAFDHWLFGRGPTRALQNIGGIANVTLVGRGVKPLAFDTGPGNCLLDLVAQRLSQGRCAFDRHGELAAEGRIDPRAIRRLWADGYFRRRPPKSTGREQFNAAWLAERLGASWPRRLPDVLATLTYFTAYSIAESYRRFFPRPPTELIVSGGGVYNRTLMGHLSRLVQPVLVRSIDAYGIAPLAKEPAAFAWLALQAMRGHVNHLPSTTGASAPRVLGTITPGRSKLQT